MQDRVKSVVALAAPSVALGVFFTARGYIRVGWAFIALALLIFAVAILSMVAPALVVVLLWVSWPLRWIGNYVWSWLLRAIAVVRQTQRNLFHRGGPMLDFVAQTPRIYMHSQQADYKLITKPRGVDFGGVAFAIRPNYQFGYWRAGFRLVRHGENLLQGDIGDTVLFHLAQNQSGVQPTNHLIARRGIVQSGGIQNHPNARWPLFRVSATVWPTQNPARLRIGVMLEAPDAAPLEAEFDAADMDSIALLAWGDGHPFGVFFDDVRVYWRKKP